MSSDEIKIGETTQMRLSGHKVGVSNIWERELPDDKGVVAPRMSALLSILEIASARELDVMVFAGSVLELGPDRYCIVRVEEGQTAPGDIFLRKLAP